MLNRVIPSTGENLPVIGLGTWKSFDVDQHKYNQLQNVLNAYQSQGATVIDSSPMYGRSEKVIGDITSQMPSANDFFYATKVWTNGLEEGRKQMQDSINKMKRTKMDLIQIHNLVDWKTHLPELRRWKEEGKVRYIGITHYLDSGHDQLEKIISKEPIDFVQFNYSIQSRNAEKRLLAACIQHNVATLINRPFGEGSIFNRIQGKPLPEWAKEWDILSWSAYFLKYILIEMAVTCIIPATSNVQHAKDNLAAGVGKLPDKLDRKKMIDYFESL